MTAKTWHLTNIPKIAHFYWGGESLSYLRYMTVRSFRLLNPDWTIKIHTPVIVGNTVFGSMQPEPETNIDYFKQLIPLDVDIVRHDFSSEFGNQTWEVHKSDLLRWILLSTEGGLWSDFDIIYQRPISNLIENTVENSDTTVILCPYKRIQGVHAIGFLLSSANNSFFKYISEQALQKYDSSRHQSIGCELFSDFIDINIISEKFSNDTFVFADEKCVYSILYRQINDFYRSMDDNLKSLSLDDSIIGFHWYGGHAVSRSFGKTFSKENLGDSLIGYTTSMLNKLDNK